MKFDLQPTSPISLSASLEVAPPETPVSYFGTASALSAGLRPLETAGDSCASAFALIAAQTIETSLKAFLQQAATVQNWNRDPDRHKIIELWARAHKAGLGITPTPPVSISLLAKLHAWPYPLRYADTKGVFLLVLGARSEVCMEVEQLLQKVGHALSQ